MIEIIDFISAIRSTDKLTETIYLNGGCYKFYELLSSIYGDAHCVPVINSDKNHIGTAHNGVIYDITGDISELEAWTAMSHDDIELAKSWSFSNNKLSSIGDCPHCGAELYMSGDGVIIF
jgi:hypothetical protein